MHRCAESRTISDTNADQRLSAEKAFLINRRQRESPRNNLPQQYLQLIAKCWADEAFKQRLVDNAAETLRAEGMELPEGMRVEAVENTAQDFTLVIPAQPTDLSDEELDGAVGGWSLVVGY